jgi:hypothetical protein
MIGCDNGPEASARSKDRLAWASVRECCAVVQMFAYGVDAPVALQLLAAAPIALQEMILAVLLMWKGFAAPSATAANGEPRRGSG